MKSPFLQIVTVFFLVASFCCLTGCNAPDDNESGAAADAPVRKVSVKLLVIDDTSLGAVIKRQFGSRRNGDVHLTEMTWDDLAASDYQAVRDNDVVIYPSWRLGELASRDLLVSITEDNARLEDNDNRALLFSDREQAISWAGQQVATSLGQSHWVMLYRSDVLEAVESEPPTTWKEFDKLAEKIAALENAGLPSRIAVPLQGHWASYSLLARTASAIRLPGKYSSYFDVNTMKPLVDSPPFLESLQAMQKQVSRDGTPQSPQQVIADYLNGNVAVAMVPVNHHWLAGDEGSRMPGTVIGRMPGWVSVYDSSRETWNEQLPGTLLTVPLTGTTGMLASCSVGTNQQRNAIEVMQWITSKQISSIVSVESGKTGLSRKSHLGNPAKWLGPLVASDNLSQYTDYLTELNDGRRVLTALRIPQAGRYLDALDGGVRNVILQQANVVETLAAVAMNWSGLNEEIGMESQKQAYRKSEGLGQ